jgi:hypothetical protein
VHVLAHASGPYEWCPDALIFALNSSSSRTSTGASTSCSAIFNRPAVAPLRVTLFDDVLVVIGVTAVAALLDSRRTAKA